MRCDTEKKRTKLIFLIFPLIWAFYFIFMKGHILHWESTDFFCQIYGHIVNNFCLKPGGWGEYLSHFVLQYFQWPWLGALVLTLLLMAIFVSVGAFCHLAIAECWPVLECFLGL
ncbi:MAG: DUF6057 family protein [Odoribacter sp.]